jgi:putative transcriptional regulator
MSVKSLKGHLLVATPQLLDPNFARTVLLLFEHSPEGAAGVVLNRATEMTVSDVSAQLLEELIDWDKTINLGGPVPGPLMALHGDEDLADRNALEGLYLTVEANKLRAVLDRRVEPSLIVANYAGWGPGQLDREITEDSWYSLPATIDYVFWAETNDLWVEVVRVVNRQRISDLLGTQDLPEDPTLN